MPGCTCPVPFKIWMCLLAHYTAPGRHLSASAYFTTCSPPTHSILFPRHPYVSEPDLCVLQFHALWLLAGLSWFSQTSSVFLLPIHVLCPFYTGYSSFSSSDSLSQVLHIISFVSGLPFNDLYTAFKVNLIEVQFTWLKWSHSKCEAGVLTNAYACVTTTTAETECSHYP